MPRLTVSWKSQDRLQVTKTPGTKSWSFLVGIVALGLGAAFSGEDCLLLKSAYILGCFIIGICFLEDWEDCIFDKSVGKITFQKENFVRRMFHLTSSNRVVLTIGNVMEVKASTCMDDSCRVELILSTGIVVPLIESKTTGSFSDHDVIAATIRKFLGLERVERLDCKDDSCSFLPDSSSDSDTPTSSDTENDTTNNEQVLWIPREQVVNVALPR